MTTGRQNWKPTEFFHFLDTLTLNTSILLTSCSKLSHQLKLSFSRDLIQEGVEPYGEEEHLSPANQLNLINSTLRQEKNLVLCMLHKSPQFRLYYTGQHIWGFYDDAKERVKHTNISINTWLTLLYEMQAVWVDETSRGAVEAHLKMSHNDICEIT